VTATAGEPAHTFDDSAAYERFMGGCAALPVAARGERGVAVPARRTLAYSARVNAIKALAPQKR
jgi:hypothetical protein